jgi:hypothetical protein
MANKTPISLIIDDGTPSLHPPYYAPWVDKKDGVPVLKNGSPIIQMIPNDFAARFCDAADRYGFAGKYSIVPAPKGEGDIISGIKGVTRQSIDEWLNIIKTRLTARFDFSPEVISHLYALDLNTMQYLDLDEETWSFQQDYTTLTPYIAYALDLLKKAGIDASGVTSPWSFGMKVEDEYARAIAAAELQVYGRKLSWYFLHTYKETPGTKPVIQYKDDISTVVSVICTIEDYLWETIEKLASDDAYINSIADKYISEDGKSGSILSELAIGSWPIILTHWQSLFSNGHETGLKILKKVGERVQRHLHERVEWKTCLEMCEMVVQ